MADILRELVGMDGKRNLRFLEVSGFSRIQRVSAIVSTSSTTLAHYQSS